MLEGPVLLAFGLTLFAGLSTGIGSAIAFFSSRTNTRFLAVSLGLSAGVMIYVSFVEIIPKAHESLTTVLGESAASWATTAGFFAGILVMAALDRLPALEGGNPHELRLVEEMTEDERRQHRLMRMGLFSAFAIALHNFPEGLATFLSTLEDPSVGVSIAVAIAIHNIPEGIAVAVPIYYATGSRRRAFQLSFLSGSASRWGRRSGTSCSCPSCPTSCSEPSSPAWPA